MKANSAMLSSVAVRGWIEEWAISLWAWLFNLNANIVSAAMTRASVGGAVGATGNTIKGVM